jgi:hypothetical protein
MVDADCKRADMMSSHSAVWGALTHRPGFHGLRCFAVSTFFTWILIIICEFILLEMSRYGQKLISGVVSSVVPVYVLLCWTLLPLILVT